jgi:hypothetical protein
MRRFLIGLVLAGVTLTQPLSLSSAAAKDEAKFPAMPKVGDPAPNFKLQYADKEGSHQVSLSDYRGKKQVVLAFYVFAFTGG